jgi:hypothetical protein
LRNKALGDFVLLPGLGVLSDKKPVQPDHHQARNYDECENVEIHARTIVESRWKCGEEKRPVGAFFSKPSA